MVVVVYFFRSIFCRYTNQFSVLHFCTMCEYSVRVFFFSRYPDAFFFSLWRSFSCSLALYSVLHRFVRLVRFVQFLHWNAVGLLFVCASFYVQLFPIIKIWAYDKT